MRLVDHVSAGFDTAIESLAVTRSGCLIDANEHRQEPGVVQAF
jgi:hypothetical protein